MALLPAYVATITPVEKFGARLGTIFLCVGIALLVGPPTAGAFVPVFTQENFDHLIIFTGVLMVISVLLLGVVHRIDANAIRATAMSPGPPQQQRPQLFFQCVYEVHPYSHWHVTRAQVSLKTQGT